MWLTGALVVGAAALPVPYAGVSNAATTPSAAVDVDPGAIDTLAYFINSSGRGLAGAHPFSQTVVDHDIYNVKWAADAYEHYSYDDNYIYLREDHAGSSAPTSYTFTDGVWMKRLMKVGDQVSAASNGIQNYTFSGTTCTPTTQGVYPYVNTLTAHIPSDNLGGTLGVQDVIVLRYDYRDGVGSDYELMYYAKGLGMVLWELYHNGTVSARSPFNEYGAPPTPPDLSNACGDTLVPRHVPALPTTLSGLVSEMYSCVLNIGSPDSPGFNTWLSNLRSKALTVPAAYAAFYGYQPTTVTNAQFAASVYDCMLYRDDDAAALTDLTNRLNANTLTRPQLRQAILGSAEFTGRILPRLNALT